MSTVDTVAIIGLVVTVALGLPALYWGWHAHRRGMSEEKGREAQRKVESERAAKDEERREQARRAQEERQRDLKRARFDVTLGSRDGRGRLQFKVVNRGPLVARDVVVSLAIEGRVLSLGESAALVENGQLIAPADLGRIAGTYTVGADRIEVTHPAIDGELAVSFVDGNGPRTLLKRLSIGAGSHFEQRSFTITDI